MVCESLKLNKAPQEDAADALAGADCHGYCFLYLQSIPITTVENNSHQIKPNVIKSVSNLLHVFYLIMEMWYHIKRFMLNFVKRNFLS
jgi:hypothetical protein